ncbi:TetR/AcrR family transcriptional regulator [Candidatus Binatus sp.]|uniref:TetR/AcrR family transcriptional regulator n=1 Tax=Candidatus Binatus sp. TaxID=2811406 RepID=UPI003C4C55A2
MKQLAAEAERVDGRIIRRRNNRRRIVAAMLELVRAGAISPVAEEVAERAGVGLRTVFRHFDDMDSLYREMAEAMRNELQPIVAAPLASRDCKGRLGEIVDRRVRLFERAMPFKNAADVHRHRSAFLRKDYEMMRSAERAALEAALPAALRNDKRFFEALDQALSFSTWQHLRRDQKLTQARARETIEYAMRALVNAASK